jgi:hypothetical protein
LSDPHAEFGRGMQALTMLRLCRASRQRGDGVADVRVVAERFGCDEAKLAVIVSVELR